MATDSDERLGGRKVSGSVDPDVFRQALSRFASGVTIVTTSDPEGNRYGFTASAFSSLSLDPPLILVCLATSAESHPVFADARRFIVNVLRPEHESLALRFAKKGIDKFEDGEFRPGAGEGLPVLDSALFNLKCRVHERYEGGDHTILVGAVDFAYVHDGEPMLLYDRRFHHLAGADA